MASLRDDAGNAGMAYNFAERLIGQGMSAGEALTDLRRTVDVANRWWYWKNYLTFNLWGDPSIGIESHAQAPEPIDAGVDPVLMDAGVGPGMSDAGLQIDDAGAEEPDAEMTLDMTAMQDSQPDAEERPDSGGLSMDGSQSDQQTPDAGYDAPEEDTSSGGCVAGPGGRGSAPVLLALCLFLFTAARRRRHA